MQKNRHARRAHLASQVADGARRVVEEDGGVLLAHILEHVCARTHACQSHLVASLDKKQQQNTNKIWLRKENGVSAHRSTA